MKNNVLYYLALALFVMNVQAQTAQSSELIFSAIAQGDTAKISELVNQDKNIINTKDRSGSTPLMRAAVLGKKNIVELLIKLGAKIDATDNNGANALMYATQGGHIDIVKLIYDKSPNSINALTGDKDTPLIALLARYNDNINNKNLVQDKEKYKRNLKEIINFFIEKRLNINAQNKNGTTALMYAAGWGEDDFVRLLIAKGANPCLYDTFKRTAHEYVPKGKTDLVKYLQDLEDTECWGHI